MSTDQLLQAAEILREVKRELRSVRNDLRRKQAAEEEIRALIEKSKAKSLATATVTPNVRESDCSALFRICTARIDRVTDIIEPSGVDWTEYAKNPVVLYQHNNTDVKVPVATSEGPDGKVHIFYGHPDGKGELEDAIYARAFFDLGNELSRQMYNLVKSGLLAGASISIVPIVERPLLTGRRAMTSTMLEWSLSPTPINPDCLNVSRILR